MFFERARRVLRLKHPLIQLRFYATESVHFGRGRSHGKKRFRFGQREFHVVAEFRVRRASRASAISPVNSVARNSPVDKSTRASPINDFARCSTRFSVLAGWPSAPLSASASGSAIGSNRCSPSLLASFGRPQRDNYFLLARSARMPVAVPGVRTRITSRRTSFFPAQALPSARRWRLCGRRESAARYSSRPRGREPRTWESVRLFLCCAT